MLLIVSINPEMINQLKQKLDVSLVVVLIALQLFRNFSEVLSESVRVKLDRNIDFLFHIWRQGFWSLLQLLQLLQLLPHNLHQILITLALLHLTHTRNLPKPLIRLHRSLILNRHQLLRFLLIPLIVRLEQTQHCFRLRAPEHNSPSKIRHHPSSLLFIPFLLVFLELLLQQQRFLLLLIDDYIVAHFMFEFLDLTEFLSEFVDVGVLRGVLAGEGVMVLVVGFSGPVEGEGGQEALFDEPVKLVFFGGQVKANFRGDF